MFHNFLIIQLFIVIGNKRANDFWAGNLQKDEELHMDSPVEKRKTFITQKYKEGRFRKTLLASLSKEELNKVSNKTLQQTWICSILLNMCQEFWKEVRNLLLFAKLFNFGSSCEIVSVVSPCFT